MNTDQGSQFTGSAWIATLTEAGVRISSPGAYGAYPFWDRRLDVVGIVAREGALQTGFEGVSVERAVRAQVEAWNNCR